MKIIVVGAGVVGLSSAYELCLDGHEVTVIDAAAAGQAASRGNAAKIAIAEATPVPAPGMVVQGLKWMLRSDSPLYIRPSPSPSLLRFLFEMARNCNATQFRHGLEQNLRLCSHSNELLDEWRSAGLDFEMHSRGVMLAYSDERHMRARLAFQDLFDAYGAPATVLDGGEARALEPALSEATVAALFYPEDRQVEPTSLMRALASAIGRLDGAVLEGVAADRFESSFGRVSGVRVSDERVLSCDAVVLTAGVWTPSLTAKLGIRMPIQPGKGYSIDYLQPEPFTLRTSLTFDEAHVAVTPLDGLIRVAGTMEFSGFSDRISPKRVAAIERAAAEGLDGWDPNAPRRAVWSGMRPMTTDGLPVVGKMGNLNVWIASGHAMLGLAQAPTTAREVRSLIRGATPAYPALGPQRFK